MKKTLLSLSIFALAACGGGSSEDKANIFGGGGGGSGGMSSITGVWDATENLGDEGIDEGYLVIDKNGALAFYDYMGDSHDLEGNCYWITIGQLKSVGNNNYEYTRIDDEVGTKPDVLTFTRNGDKLVIDFNDSEDPTEDILTTTKSNKSASDFTPECPDDMGSTDARNKVGNRTKKLVQP